MMELEGALLWELADWKEEAQAWIHAQLELLGITASGEITQPHVRPWSTVMTIPTNRGFLYFKASAPECLSETALTVYLALRSRLHALRSGRRFIWHSFPDCTPCVLAADLPRAWMLMAHGGDRLRTLIKGMDDLHHWYPALHTYANLQVEQSACLFELLQTGTPDRRLSFLPGLYERLLADVDTLQVGQPESLTYKEYERLCKFVPQFAVMCERLAAFGLPETLQHDDLHDGNIFVHEGRAILFDWGDACISHPFFSLVVILRSAENTLSLEQDDPLLVHLRDVYLEDWSAFGSRETLSEAADLALQIGMVCRALTWHKYVAGMAGPFREKYIGYVGAWLQEFHQAVVIGA